MPHDKITRARIGRWLVAVGDRLRHQREDHDPQRHNRRGAETNTTADHPQKSTDWISQIDNKLGTFLEQQQTHYTETRGDSKKQSSVGLATAVGTCIAACFAFLAFGAAAYQAYIARSTEHRQLRAYVGVTEVKTVEAENGQIGFAITIKNFGATPAYDTFARGSVNMQSCSNTQTYVIGDYVGQPQLRSETLFPENPQDITVPIKLSLFIGDKNSILERTKCIVSYGSVYYRDAFYFEHSIDFCAYFIPTESVAPLCRNHNGEKTQ